MKVMIQAVVVLASITGMHQAFAQAMSKPVVATSPSDSIDKVMAARVSTALAEARRIRSLSYQEVRALLMGEQFEEFERLSKDYEDHFHKDPLYESPLLKLYEVVAPDDVNDLRLLEKVDKWVKVRPSYMSYCARGIFKQRLGYLYRGEKSTFETPKRNFDKMRAVHREAFADFMRALQLNAKFPPSYVGLLLVEMADGSVDAANQIIKKVVREIPTTYYVRFTYLRNIRPRWGGSYEAMESFARSQVSAASLNPRIWSLQAEASAERGYSALLEHNYQAAIDYYTDALRYGDRMEFLHQRGLLYQFTRNYPMALRDFTQYLIYEPESKEVVDRVSCLRLLIAGGPCSQELPASSSDRNTRSQSEDREDRHSSINPWG